MPETDVLAELRALRDETARRLGGDAWALARELADRSRAAGRVPVRLPRREPEAERASGKQPA